MASRPFSYAICGGAFGDEGKGRIVDEYVAELSQQRPTIVYRDNGGANAGHTVELPDGTKIAFHQVPSGVFCTNTTVMLGKEMVLHPADLLLELKEITKHAGKRELARILIDHQALLSLDTHRAYEAALKMWQSGGKGSTGRGIAPAYADLLLRHPIRMRDLVIFDCETLTQHYRLYEALLKGLDQSLKDAVVPTAGGGTQKVGSLKQFLETLSEEASQLKKMTVDTLPLIEKAWNGTKNAFVFEKAQAVGLDHRWGVYPDVTASNTCFDGIYSATEGVVDPRDIEVRAAVIKATYMSSVGSRKLPSAMTGKLATTIREDAGEYGATTKRPRDIAYLDLAALKFYAKVGGSNCHILTHMDIIVYPRI